MATTPPRNPSDAGFSDSDQAWFDHLTGQPGAADQPQARAEALALRKVLQRQIEIDAAHPDVVATGTAEWQARHRQALDRRLLQVGVRLGAAPPAAPPPKPRPWWSTLTDTLTAGWRFPAAAGLAATLVLGTVLVVNRPDQPVYPDASVSYGESDTQRAQAANPRQAADALAAALRQQGLKVAQYQRGKTFLVDINLKPDELPLAEPGLKALGLAPRPGQTRIEISPR